MTTRALQIECLLDPVIDPNTGVIASSGYTAYFYSAGTSNAKNVWTEKEKTNPFTSYALGSDGAIQLYGDGIYKIIVKNIDGDTIHEWDNIKIEASNFLITTKAATYTVTPDDDVVLVDTDGGNITINLEAVANFTYPVVIKNVGSNQVTVDPDGAETIDGAATITLSALAHATLYPNTASGLWHRTVDVAVVEDSDGDTKIQVEESSDEDIIRFDIAGTEQIILDDGKLEPTTDNDVDLGSSSKEFKNLYVDGIAFVDEFDLDGTYQAAFPTNPSGAFADAKIMLGIAGTTVWMYENTAPVGWKVSAVGGDTVLAVSGGSQEYNINGGTLSAATWTVSGLSCGNQDTSHTHTLATDGDESSRQLAAPVVISGGRLYTTDADSGSYSRASSTTGNQSASHQHTISQNAGWRPAASVGRLYDLDTA